MEASRSDSDEIDLLHLLARVIRFFLQNWLVIALSLAIGLGTAYYSYRHAQPVFESRMLVESRFLNETYAIHVVQDLANLIAEGAQDDVATKLDISPADASLVRGISVERVLTDKYNIPEIDKVVFMIVVQILDPAVLPKLQSGVVHFFENNEFVKLRVTEKRKGYEDLLAQMDREMGTVNGQAAKGGTLYPVRVNKTRDNQLKGSPNQVIFDPSLMTVFAFRERMDTEEKLHLLKGVEVVHGFSASHNPVKPKFSFYMASGLSSGILLTCILLGIRSLQLLLKKYPA